MKTKNSHMFPLITPEGQARVALEKDRVAFPPPPKLPTVFKRALACFGLGLFFCVVFPRFFPLLALSFYVGMAVIWFTDRQK